MQKPNSILQKIQSIKRRAFLLTKLRNTVALPPNLDIEESQWQVLENQLAAVSSKILNQLRLITENNYSEKENLLIKQKLINQLGALELELTNAYNFYDTYIDILTQRLSPQIGKVLKGCDKIATYALNRADIMSISASPLVYCERGFGASTLREGVNLTKNIPNPIPFIAIPYSRISEKYNLISIFHEVGHQAMAKLNMVPIWKEVFYQALKSNGATELTAKLFSNWSKEIIPDFWGFGLAGIGQTSSLKDILMLPNEMMFQLSDFQPHPPSFIRFLVSVEWCKQQYGRGIWDDWDTEWRQMYSTNSLAENTKLIIEEAIKFIPIVARAVLMTKFKKLGGKPLCSILEPQKLNPDEIIKLANVEGILSETFTKKTIGFQLATFRLIQEQNKIKPAELDQYMTAWLNTISN